MYTPSEIDRILKSMVVLVDTREQPTAAFHKRMELLPCGHERQKLDFGDYSCKICLLNGDWIYLDKYVSIERKMNLDELCQCFTNGRERFKREFLRAKEAGAKTFLLVENGSWENLLNGKYRSRFNPNAFSASILLWCSRYNIQLEFCKAETTSSMIYKLLYYYTKYLLEEGKISV